MDILQATLAAGIRVVKYVPSYGDQPNDITNVTKCTYSSDCLVSLRPADVSVCVCRLQGQIPGVPCKCACLDRQRASMGVGGVLTECNT